MARVRSGNPQAENECLEPAHEHTDVRLKPFLGLVALVIVGAFVIHGALWAWFRSLGGRAAPAENATWKVVTERVPSSAGGFPELQLNPQADLREYQRANELRLKSYGWIQPEAGIIQVPIRHSMQLILEKGLPQWQGPSEQRKQSQEGGQGGSSETGGRGTRSGSNSAEGQNGPRPEEPALGVSKESSQQPGLTGKGQGTVQGSSEGKVTSRQAAGKESGAGVSPLQLQYQRARRPGAAK